MVTSLKGGHNAGIRVLAVQKFISEWIFPVSNTNWYNKSCKQAPSFKGFFDMVSVFDHKQELNYLNKKQLSRAESVKQKKILRSLRQTQKAFSKCEFDLEKYVLAKFAHNSEVVKIDTVSIKLKNDEFSRQKPGYGKHIIKFIRANSYYEGNFKDLGLESSKTWAFEIGMLVYVGVLYFKECIFDALMVLFRFFTFSKASREKKLDTIGQTIRYLSAAKPSSYDELMFERSSIQSITV